MTTRKARRAWKVALRKHVKPGTIFLMEFRHEPDCLIYSPAKVCTCNPDRALIDENQKTVALVENAGPYDPLEVLQISGVTL